MSKTQMWAASSKTQFYNTDGTGRDTYISLHNGGFCPPHEPTKIEELGKFKMILRIRNELHIIDPQALYWLFLYLLFVPGDLIKVEY